MSKTSNIETKMAKLRELVAWFEGDEFRLEQANEKFVAATKLAKGIETELSEMKNTITVLKESFDK